MTQQLWFGVLLLVVLLLVGFLIGKYFKFKLWTIGIAVSLVSLAFFYLPSQNYTWMEWTLDNIFGWGFVGVLYIFGFVIDIFTTTE